MNLESRIKDITKIKSIHFVGIKGVAMTALAIIVKEMGMQVTGSDVSEKFPTDETLKKFGIPYFTCFNADHIPQLVDLVIYSGAFGKDKNVETAEVLKRKITVLPHGQALGLFMQGKKQLSVAGSHGKTTTSALIAHVLMKAGKDPSFAIGCGEIVSLKTPAHAGKGEWFVAEADEYATVSGEDMTPRFMWQKPDILVITNIDFDHPDVYTDLSAVQNAFVAFTKQVAPNGVIVLNADDPPTTSVYRYIEVKQKILFGKSKSADIQLLHCLHQEGGIEFQVYVFGKQQSFRLPIPGEHNALNATAAIAALVSLGLSTEQIRAGLATFIGTKRRFEKIAEVNGKLLIDDYAHHPAEIRSTLNAAKAAYPEKRIIAIFQPHTYSRTKSLLNEFATCFSDADHVILTDIYASAREKENSDISGHILYEKVKEHKKELTYAPNRSAVLEYIQTKTAENDLILTMGAGDIYTWLPKIVKVL